MREILFKNWDKKLCWRPLAHVPDKVGDEVVMVAPEALLELYGLAASVRHVLRGQRKSQLSLQLNGESSTHGKCAETPAEQRKETQLENEAGLSVCVNPLTFWCRSGSADPNL